MTFSDFLKTLKKYYARNLEPYYKKDASGNPVEADFVRAVFVAATVGGEDLLPDISLPQKLYSGSKSISEQLAEKVISDLDKERFIEFLSTLESDDSISKLRADFGYESNDTNGLFNHIFELFVSYLDAATKGKSKSIRRNAEGEFGAEIAHIKLNKPTPDMDLSGFFQSHIPAKEFINREAPRKLFYDVIDSKPPFEKNVIMYYGIGGIGKSSLVKNLKEYTGNHNVLYSSVDFDNPAMRSPYKALIELEKKLNATLPHFDVAVTLCFIKRNPEFSYRDSGLPNNISREVLRLLQTSDTISLYNATSGLTKRVYAELGKKFGLDASIQQQLAALEELSATDIEEQLSVFFAVDLYRHIVIESLDRCVLFFDTYELLWENGQGDANKLHNDAWVRKMASMTMLNNVIFVLSGREKLLWELESETWSDKIQLVALDVLAPEFAVRYLDICEIIDREIQDSIVAASQGHPYYLDLCVDTYYKLINAHKPVNPDSFGKGFQEIQERFFRSLGANEVTMLNVLSVPRFYDFEIFESLASRFNKSYSTANFKSFNAFSFIKHEVSGKYIIHILMRDEIKKHMDTDLKRSINAAMIKYFNEKLSPERIAVEDVRYYFAELLFHLEAAESRGKLLERVENEFIGIIKRLQLSGETNYLLEQFSDVFNESRNVLGGTEFFAVMADMIHLSGRYREAVEIITDYLDRFRIDEIARDGYCLNLYIRRTHHQMFYTPLQILNGDLNKIIDLIDREKDIPQYCEILFMLGAHIYLPMGDFDKACDYLRRMNKIAKKHGLYGLLCRGLRKFAEVLCARKNYVSAEKVCLVGLRIARAESMWRYEFYLRCILGEVKRLSGNTEEAMAIFEEAVPTAESLGIKGWIGHVNLALGNCYTDLGNFAKAFECYDIARKFYGDIGQKWGEVNLETAYQRTLLLSDCKADENELIRLKQECDELGYKVLTNKIDGLLDGNREIIRFEYL